MRLMSSPPQTAPGVLLVPFYQIADLLHHQGNPILIAVQAVIQHAVVGEKSVFVDVQVPGAHVEGHADAAVGLVLGVPYLHHQIGAEIPVSAVGGAVLLGAPQIGHHGPPVLLVRRLVEEVLGQAAVEQHLDGVHDRGLA